MLRMYEELFEQSQTRAKKKGGTAFDPASDPQCMDNNKHHEGAQYMSAIHQCADFLHRRIHLVRKGR